MKIRRNGGDSWLNSIIIGGIFSCAGFMVKSSSKFFMFMGFAILWFFYAILIKIYYEMDEKLKKANKKSKKKR